MPYPLSERVIAGGGDTVVVHTLVHDNSTHEAASSCTYPQVISCILQLSWHNDLMSLRTKWLAHA